MKAKRETLGKQRGIGLSALTVVLSIFLIFWSNSGSAQGTLTLPEIQTQTNVDETLFLVRILESLYDQWPTDKHSAGEFSSASSGLREAAIKYKEHIQANKLDSDLGSRFKDLITCLDNYTTFLSNIDAIKNGDNAKLISDGFSSGYKGGFAGATTLAALNESGSTPSEGDIATSIIVAGITWATDAWQKANARDEAQTQAIDAEVKRIKDEVQASLFQAQATAQNLAKEHGWDASEIGWDLSDNQAVSASGLDEVSELSVAERAAGLRPRDPEPRVRRNILKAQSSQNDSSILYSAGMDTYACASLVPADSVYDDYRSLYVSTAAAIMSLARAAEIGNGIAVYGTTTNSRMAVLLWRKCLELSPTDASGQLRFYLADTLMENDSLNEAREIAGSIAELHKSDPDFSYDYACLMSRCSDATDALNWLRYAFETGFVDVNHAKNDPDFKYVRDNAPSDFNTLVTPNWEYRVNYGIFFSDIAVTNCSPFTLSNVVLTVRFQSQNSDGTTQANSYELRYDHIPAAQEKTKTILYHRPQNIGNNLNVNATLKCDEDGTP